MIGHFCGYTGLFSDMQGCFAQPYKKIAGIQVSVEMCRSLLRYTGLCCANIGHFGGYTGLFAMICRALCGHTRLFVDVQGYLGICSSVEQIYDILADMRLGFVCVYVWLLF